MLQGTYGYYISVYLDSKCDPEMQTNQMEKFLKHLLSFKKSPIQFLGNSINLYDNVKLVILDEEFCPLDLYF